MRWYAQVEDLQLKYNRLVASRRSTQDSIGSTRSSLLSSQALQSHSSRAQVSTLILAFSETTKGLRAAELDESTLQTAVERLRVEAAESNGIVDRIAAEREKLETELERVERKCANAEDKLVELDMSISARDRDGLSHEELAEREAEETLRKEYAWMEEMAARVEVREMEVGRLQKQLERARESLATSSEDELTARDQELARWATY